MPKEDRQVKLMGNAFEFTAIHDDQDLVAAALSAGIAEVRRIESILTTFNKESITYQINENAGIRPVAVPSEVLELIARAQYISQITQGAFDLSYGSADHSLWNFDTTMKVLPSSDSLLKSVHLINYKNIIIDKSASTIFLSKAGMRIGFGGIGKGYAAMRAKEIMVNLGITSGVVNAAGDMTAWGCQENGKPWSIGIAHPEAKHTFFSTLTLHNQSIATSGNYEKYIDIAGVRYSHTIDPKTGMPIKGIKSVSILAANAELADALTTPVMIMGTEVGIHLINQLTGVAAIIVDDDDKIFISANLDNLQH
jgi:FAD:protein FMN transferase